MASSTTNDSPATSPEIAGKAVKTLRVPAHGRGLLQSGLPGSHSGGRPPDQFRKLLRELVSREETLEALTRILNDDKHIHFMKAMEWSARHGYRLDRDTGEGPRQVAFVFVTEGKRFDDAAEVRALTPEPAPDAP